MITNYIQPQLLIRQLLEVLPAITEPSLNTFVYGPQHKLNRYYESEERALMFGTEFEARAEGQERLYVGYEGVDKAGNVDLNSVRLFAEDMELSYANFDSAEGETELSPNNFMWNDIRRPNEIQLVNNSNEAVNLYDPANSLAVELDGRPVRIGDLVIVTENIEAGVSDRVHRRRIMDVKRAIEASVIGSIYCGSKNLKETSASAAATSEAITGISTDDNIVIATDQNGIVTRNKFLVVGSNYGGQLKEKFSVRFTKDAYWDADAEGGAASVNGECRVRTATDNFEADDVAVSYSASDSGATFNIAEAGITVTIPTARIYAGDSFDFVVARQYTAFNCDSGTSFDAETFGENYLHKQDTTIVVSCVGGDVNGVQSVWYISDSSGVEDVLEVTGQQIRAGVSFGSSGVGVKLTKVEHASGEEFAFDCTAVGATGEHSVLVLDGPTGDLTSVDEDELDEVVPASVEIRGTFAGEIGRRALNAPREQWTAEKDGIKLEADLAYECFGFGADQIESRFCKFASEDTTTPLLFASYNELCPAQPDEKIIRVSKSSDLIQFGKKDVENKLAFGAAAAYSGSQGKAIYVARIESNDLAGYQEVLRKAENIDALYAHVPLTEDLDVQLEVRAHVDSMSNESNKKWRRAYVATEVPGDYRVLGGKSSKPTTGTIVPSGDGNVVVQDPEGNFVGANVKNGDLFRINYTSDAWGESTYDQYEDGGYVIHRVVDNETLVLKSGPAKPINVARRYEVWKKDNAENIADFIAARSANLGSRRVSNIFCDGGQYLTDDDEFISIPNMFIAAEIAGLRTAVLPQQGLTNTEIALVASAPNMYVRYNKEHLNRIAANGSFIVAQEYDDGPRFIRHQLTTKSDKGNLYYEDSVGVNIDEISFQVKSELRPYIGRRNVNPATLRDIFDDMFQILKTKTQDPGFGNSIGPALIGFTDLVVRINDTFKDRIDVSAQLQVPLPLNVIDVTLNATASFNAGEITLESVGITEVVGTSVEDLLNDSKTAYSSDGEPINPIYG